jgi:hypothetical protein
MRSLKTIAVGFSMIAATLAIQGVTPAQGTVVQIYRAIAATKKLEAEYQKRGRGWMWTNLNQAINRDELSRQIECAMDKVCFNKLRREWIHVEYQ